MAHHTPSHAERCGEPTRRAPGITFHERPRDAIGLLRLMFLGKVVHMEPTLIIVIMLVLFIAVAAGNAQRKGR